jgi:uncharacterized protein with PIN domain
MKLNQEELSALLGLLTLTRDSELNCEECLTLVSRFAESELTGKTPDQAMDRVRQHLSVCADCREEYQALLLPLRSGGPFEPR